MTRTPWVSANVRFHFASSSGSPIVNPPPWMENSVGKVAFDDLSCVLGMKIL